MSVTEAGEALRIVGDVEIGKLSLQPGDVLVVKIDRPITLEQTEYITKKFRAHLPADVRCMVLDPTINLSVLTRTEIEARAA